MRAAKAVDRIGRVLGAFGEFYWHPASGLQSREAFRRALGDWREALALFLEHYAFERAGRSPRYPQAAVEAVRAYPYRTPRADLEAFLWHRFRLRIAPQPPNERVNPLTPSGGGGIPTSVAALVLELAPVGHNLVGWAKRGLEEGRARALTKALRGVRGIGAKIAAFFLRDVADAFMIEVSDLEGAVCLQPIDRWTRRGAEALAPLLGSPAPGSDEDYARVLIETGRRAGVRPTLVNTGVWVLGALCVRSEEGMKKVLKDGKALRNALTRWREAHRAWLGLLEGALREVSQPQMRNQSGSL